MSLHKYMSWFTCAPVAAQHPPHIPLQVLAGPGTGKTKVLVARIAHLITTHHLPPQSICALTFSNRAAKEMRSRLYLLLGKNVTNQVKMGTFHAVCARFLHYYAELVGVQPDFKVCNQEERCDLALNCRTIF